MNTKRNNIILLGILLALILWGVYVFFPKPIERNLAFFLEDTYRCTLFLNASDPFQAVDLYDEQLQRLLDELKDVVVQYRGPYNGIVIHD